MMCGALPTLNHCSVETPELIPQVMGSAWGVKPKATLTKQKSGIAAVHLISEGPLRVSQPATPEFHCLTIDLVDIGHQYRFWCDERLIHSGRVLRGSGAVIPVGAKASYSAEGADRFLLFIPDRFLRSQEVFEGLPVNDSLEVVATAHHKDPVLHSLALELLRVMHISEEPAVKLFCDSVCVAISAHLIRSYTVSSVKLEISHRGELAPWRLRRALDYMQAHIDQPISLDVLAKVADMSQWHFSRCFKATTGDTPAKYLLKCRVDRAKHLLTAGRLSLVEISGEVGFSSQSHFTNVFHAEVGETPKRYRELTRQ